MYSGRIIVSLLLFFFTFNSFSCDKSTEPEEEEEEPVVYTIQELIDSADDGDTILVKSGTYYENISFKGKNIVLASLFLTTNDESYINNTIIDGGGNGSTVTFKNGEDSTAVLIGLTITKGQAPNGGGIYINKASPTLRNLIVTKNKYGDKGGGIFIGGSSTAQLSNITIRDNPGRLGGGIYIENSDVSLEDATIDDNESTFVGTGAGVYLENSNPIFKNVLITGNRATIAYGLSSAGAGIYCDNSSPTLINVIIENNYCNVGAGIHCSRNSNPNLYNVIISGNISEMFGGGIASFSGSNPTLENVVVTNNSAPIGKGIYCNEGNLSMKNTIFWGDSTQNILFEPDVNPSSISVSYSDIQGGEEVIESNDNGTVEWLDGNIDVDPLFEDSENGDFHLMEGSPCIDAGDPDLIYNDTDNSRNDMGAYGGPNGDW